MVNNVVLCTPKIAKSIGLMLYIFITHIIKRAGRYFLDYQYVYGINFGDGFMNVYLSSNLKIIYIKYLQLFT